MKYHIHTPGTCEYLFLWHTPQFNMDAKCGWKTSSTPSNMKCHHPPPHHHHDRTMTQQQDWLELLGSSESGSDDWHLPAFFFAGRWLTLKMKYSIVKQVSIGNDYKNAKNCKKRHKFMSSEHDFFWTMAIVVSNVLDVFSGLFIFKTKLTQPVANF